MSFILCKAVQIQIVRMKGFVFTTLGIAVVAIMGFTPETATARETEQAEGANCPCKSQRRVVRPLTEATPIPKKGKERVRRILM